MTFEIFWIPNSFSLVENWDAIGREVISDSIIVFPSIFSEKKDLLSFDEPPAEGFFAIDKDLEFRVFKKARKGIAPSLGLSLRHPFVASKLIYDELFDVAAYLGIDQDLALSCLAQEFTVKSAKQTIGCRRVDRKCNVVLQKKALQEVMDYAHPCLEKFALDEDFSPHGRALLGMTQNFSLSEILVKWGSEAAFETEKEALLYG